VKTFNIRVAIVEPGIIDTLMARRIENPSNETAYRQSARFSSVFSGALKEPVPPSLVAKKILEIAERNLAVAPPGRTKCHSR
jgi:NAD(P)-dependent dehydrogenase (short-subunit alcohol dehydrogenase family)